MPLRLLSRRLSLKRKRPKISESEVDKNTFKLDVSGDSGVAALTHARCFHNDDATHDKLR